MKFAKLALFSLIILFGSGLLLILAYSLRTNQLIAIGELGDSVFISGFNGDEAGAPRYRWTGSPRPLKEAKAIINFPVRPGTFGPVKLQLQLGAAPGQAFTAQIFANGLLIGEAKTIAGEVRDYEFVVTPKATYLFDDFWIQINSPTFTPGNGDPRSLGVKVQNVRLISSPDLRFPPLDIWLWASAYGLLLALALLPVTRKLTGRTRVPGFIQKQLYFWTAGLALVLLLPVLLLPYLAPRNLNLWYGPYLLPFAAALAAVLALFVWREKISALPSRLNLSRYLPDRNRSANPPKIRPWPFLEKGNLARNILIIFTLLYLIFSFSVIARMDYIGHADYADNGVVARNLINGRGFSADYAAQFYVKYNLPRPADTWPLLQPLLIAPFFALFGPTAFAAKLPNWLLMAALAWAIFYYGSRLFNKRTGLGAALLCLASPAFFETVAYPINDLSFTLLSFLSLCSIYRAATFQKSELGSIKAELSTKYQVTSNKAEVNRDSQLATSFPPTTDNAQPITLWLFAGIWGGLLFWSKPSGAILLVAAGLWLLYQKFSNKRIFIGWRGLFVWGGTTVIIILPILIRNLLIFRSLFYTTEQYDTWLKYNPPEERIYDLFYTNPARPLPAANQILLSGFDSFFRINSLQFQKFWNDLTAGNIINPLILGLALLGLIVFPRRRASLVGLVLLAFVTYTSFINIYWHYEIRYFMCLEPWFYLFGLFGLTWLCDKLFKKSELGSMKSESFPDNRQPTIDDPKTSTTEDTELTQLKTQNSKLKIQNFVPSFIFLAVFLLIWLPDVGTLVDSTRINGYTGRTGIVMAAEWFKQNTTSEARVMSRNIWEFSFHSDRQGAGIPANASLNDIKQVMRDYNIRYLQLDHTNLDSSGNPDWEPWKMRRPLWPLIRRELDQNNQYSGFKRIYDDKFGFIIYELIN